MDATFYVIRNNAGQYLKSPDGVGGYDMYTCAMSNAHQFPTLSEAGNWVREEFGEEICKVVVMIEPA
jgi:hypothetical protein